MSISLIISTSSFIFKAVCFPTNRLELRFRPDNFHCKPAIADKDMRPGILIKVKVPKNRNESEKDNNHNGGLDYEVVGVTVMNFNFNRKTFGCSFLIIRSLNNF